MTFSQNFILRLFLLHRPLHTTFGSFPHVIPVRSFLAHLAIGSLQPSYVSSTASSTMFGGRGWLAWRWVELRQSGKRCVYLTGVRLFADDQQGFQKGGNRFGEQKPQK